MLKKIPSRCIFKRFFFGHTAAEKATIDWILSNTMLDDGTRGWPPLIHKVGFPYWKLKSWRFLRFILSSCTSMMSFCNRSVVSKMKEKDANLPKRRWPLQGTLLATSVFLSLKDSKLLVAPQTEMKSSSSISTCDNQECESICVAPPEISQSS